MCLSTIYMDSGNGQKEVMKEAAELEADGNGYWVSDLFGERKFFEGSIQHVNLIGGSFIVLKSDKST
jgi:predicted RNA-binding protein